MNIVSLLAAVTLLVTSAPARAHGGEDHSHDDDKKTAAAQFATALAPRAVATSDEFELVATLEDGKLVVHVDSYASNAPVAGARLAIDGAIKGTATEVAPGVYVIAAAGVAAGRHPLAIAIETAAGADLLAATLEIAPPPAAARQPLPWWQRWFAPVSSTSTPAPSTATAVAPATARRHADGSVLVPKSVQHRLGLRTSVARSDKLAATVELNGRIVADPATAGRVQAPFAGSVEPGPQGMPLPGRRVAKGEVLAWLRPIASAIEHGNQQAQLADLEARLAIAASRVERFEQLEGALPQKEIEAARIERDALEKRRAFVRASLNDAVPLRAPSAGVISASGHLLAGQIVDAREALFEIVDPAHLAVEALAYDAALATNIVGASALTDNATALELKFVGGGRQLRAQALPLLFSVTTRNAAIAVGQPVRVMARTLQRFDAIAVPQAALIKGTAAETTVWVHAEAERFVARTVRSRPLDAANVAIIDGLAAGERVVTAGAGLLSQVR